MATGRPSLYKEEYCQELIEHMASGLSFESFAGRIRTNRDTLYEWAKVHPAFSDAKKTGTDLSLYFWELKGITSLHQKTFQASVYIFTMKARFKWAEQVVLKEDDEKYALEQIKRLSREDLLALAEEAAKYLPSKPVEVVIMPEIPDAVP